MEVHILATSLNIFEHDYSYKRVLQEIGRARPHSLRNTDAKAQ